MVRITGFRTPSPHVIIEHVDPIRDRVTQRSVITQADAERINKEMCGYLAQLAGDYS